tara:strand:+ start:2427 stop:3386 length:960 start_codon:yes stop_codon:yes gene_type:complete
MHDSSSKGLGILCRNLYLGANFKLLLPAATNLRLGQLAANFYRFVTLSNYPERAKYLAREIATRKPEVVCLQEVYEYVLPDHGERLDFLSLLLNELGEDSGYSVACCETATSVELPIWWKGKAGRLKVTDQIVILVSTEVAIESHGSEQYSDKIPIPMPFAGHQDETVLDVRRAFQWIDMTWENTQLRIANTHLESISEEIQSKQALELICKMEKSGRERILVGDLNAEPGKLVYHLFTCRPGDYSDPFKDGENTWGTGDHTGEEFMDNRQRIDHILHTENIVSRSTEVFGYRPEERTLPGKLFPSDHAGLMAVFGMPV